MNAFFSSDWHLGHANIIKYDNRPYKSVEEMNQAIIKVYNQTVKPEDSFYFLGDFCMGDHSKAESYLRQLPGNKFFIAGNHDKRETIELYKKYGTYLGHLAEVTVKGKRIVLCHYAMRIWNKSHHGVWHLYGHSHGTLPEDPHSRSFDVGINCNDYKLVSFEEVQRRMDAKDFKPIDHHNVRTT